MSLYLESDSIGSFLVDTSISYIVGRPYLNGNNSRHVNQTTLEIKISFGNSTTLDMNTTSVGIGSTDQEIQFDLEQFPPSLTPYNVTLQGSLPYSNGARYAASTQFVRLPRRTDGGSATRLDNLYGGLSVVKGNETEWSLIFPYTYYGEYTSTFAGDRD